MLALPCAVGFRALQTHPLAWASCNRKMCYSCFCKGVFEANSKDLEIEMTWARHTTLPRSSMGDQRPRPPISNVFGVRFGGGGTMRSRSAENRVSFPTKGLRGCFGPCFDPSANAAAASKEVGIPRIFQGLSCWVALVLSETLRSHLAPAGQRIAA